VSMCRSLLVPGMLAGIGIQIKAELIDKNKKEDIQSGQAISVPINWDIGFTKYLGFGFADDGSSININIGIGAGSPIILLFLLKGKLELITIGTE